MKKILITISLFYMTFLFSSSIIGQFSGTLYYGVPNILSAGIETSGDYIVEVFEIDPKGLKELLNN